MGQTSHGMSRIIRSSPDGTWADEAGSYLPSKLVNILNWGWYSYHFLSCSVAQILIVCLHDCHWLRWLFCSSCITPGSKIPSPGCFGCFGCCTMFMVADYIYIYILYIVVWENIPAFPSNFRENASCIDMPALHTNNIHPPKDQHIYRWWSPERYKSSTDSNIIPLWAVSENWAWPKCFRCIKARAAGAVGTKDDGSSIVMEPSCLWRKQILKC